MKLYRQRKDAENLGRYTFNPAGAKLIRELKDTPENRAIFHETIISYGKPSKWRIKYDDGTHDDVFEFGKMEVNE
jgi:hypothetical protein